MQLDMTTVKKYLTVILVCIALVAIQQMHVYVALTKKRDSPVYPTAVLPQSSGAIENFVWQDYLDLNPDLRANGITTEKDAIAHYRLSGKNEGRACVRQKPLVSSSIEPVKQALIDLRSEFRGQKSGRVLVIYHISKVTYTKSWDVLANNVKIFCSTLTWRTKKQRRNPIYLFSIVGGMQNPLAKFIPTEAPNVLILDWENGDTNSLEMQMRIVHLLGEEIVSDFGTVLFLNDLIRGPLVKRDELDWFSTFKALLDNPEAKVGLVSTSVTCDKYQPQIGEGAYAIPGALASMVALQMLDPIHRGYLSRQHTVSEVVLKMGYNMSSVFDHIRWASSVVPRDECSVTSSKLAASLSTVSTQQYCDIKPHEVIFMLWGGEQFNQPGHVCNELKVSMRLTLASLKAEDPALDLIIPETIQGGAMRDLYKQFDQEVRRAHSGAGSGGKQSNDLQEHTVSQLHPEDNSRVCFLVRTSTMHDGEEKMMSLDYYEGLMGLIRSFLGQVNPNWNAYFFVTDDQPFDARLKELLHNYHDSRLKYVNIDPTPRLKVINQTFMNALLKMILQFTKTDAGYTATDHVLRYVTTMCTECRWVSVTNGDNAYGSEVVENILNVATSSPAGSGTATGAADTPSMLLNPIDSRNFAEQDYVFRGSKKWDQGCVGLRAMLFSNLLAFTIQPVPVMGRVDLAAVFFLRSKLVAENLYFGNFTNPEKFPCLGCQDGYLTEYLVQNRLWQYKRLPIDGLKSIVFHGPSPTLCIASGNVWFDHPHVNQVECYTHNRIAELRRHDEKSSAPRYDWHNFQVSGKYCVRLTKSAYEEAK